MPTILIQRSKGKGGYEEVGPESPLVVEVAQKLGLPVITTRPPIVPLDYGSYTITGTAGSFLSFADSGSPSITPNGALSFRGVLETAQIRARFDGVAATATEGELVNIGEKIILDVSEFVIGQTMIRTGGVSAVLKGHFYNVPALVLGGA